MISFLDQSFSGIIPVDLLKVHYRYTKLFHNFHANIYFFNVKITFFQVCVKLNRPDVKFGQDLYFYIFFFRRVTGTLSAAAKIRQPPD